MKERGGKELGDKRGEGNWVCSIASSTLILQDQANISKMVKQNNESW